MLKKLSFICLTASFLVMSCQQHSKSYLINKTQGSEYIDNSHIQIDSCNTQTIADLAQLCKIWGFLKYYHPVVAEGKYNWDFELFRIMPSILNAQSKQDKEKIYYKWIQDLGKVKQSDVPFPINIDSIKIYPDISWIEDSLALGQISEQLIDIKFAKRSNDHFYIGLEKEKNAKFKNESAYSSLSYPDTGYRLLALFRYWNIIQYYYPYKYLIDENWNDVLARFIPLIIHAKDRTEYVNVLLKLIVCIGDSHAGLFEKEGILDKDKLYRGPADISFVEDKAIVVNSKNDQLKIGDILLKIDGEPIEQIITRKLPYISASNNSSKFRDLAFELLVTNKERLYVEFDRNGKQQSDFITCIPYDKRYALSRMQQNKPLINYVEPFNILNLYLGSQEGGSIPKKINAKGIIIDLRCYPSLKVKGYWDFEQLYPAPSGFVKFTKPSIVFPGLFSFTNAPIVGKENSEYFKGKKIILINELTQSHAEFMTMKYRCAPNTLVIGSTTAGADGNISSFSLPGDIHTSISGIGIYYLNGGETQKTGIIPDIEVKPTIEGVRSGHDEVLEKAIELILND